MSSLCIVVENEQFKDGTYSRSICLYWVFFKLGNKNLKQKESWYSTWKN